MDDITAPVATLVGALLGAAGLWFANRLLGKAAFQTAINHGFKELTDQLQEERRGLMAELSAERMANSAERSQMRGEISNLRQVVESLKNVLRMNGLPIPEDAYHGSGAEAVHVLPPNADLEPTNG